MRPVLERSKLCLDHACTLFGFHGLFCTIIAGPFAVLSIPVVSTLLICTVITTQVGRHYCTQLELLPIPIGITATSNAAALGTTRFRACLPIVTGCIARVMNMFKRQDSRPEAIPMARIQTVTIAST